MYSQKLIWKCFCGKKLKLNSRGNIGNTRRCEKCSREKRNKNRHGKRSFVSKQQLILSQLMRQSLNLGMLCAFVKCRPKTLQSHISLLRKKGWHISLNGNMEYQYMGYFP